MVGEGGGLLGWDLASAFPMDAERGAGGGKSWLAAMEGDVGEEVRSPPPFPVLTAHVSSLPPY